jgi:hypothetical protein
MSRGGSKIACRAVIGMVTIVYHFDYSTSMSNLFWCVKKFRLSLFVAQYKNDADFTSLRYIALQTRRDTVRSTNTVGSARLLVTMTNIFPCGIEYRDSDRDEGLVPFI